MDMAIHYLCRTQDAQVPPTIVKTHEPIAN